MQLWRLDRPGGRLHEGHLLLGLLDDELDVLVVSVVGRDGGHVLVGGDGGDGPAESALVAAREADFGLDTGVYLGDAGFRGGEGH